MRLCLLTTFFLIFLGVSARAEIIEADNGSLSVYGSACEDIRAGIQNATTRLKATDKASFNAVSSLPEIIDIKQSFDDHDYNVMIYNIVDEYLEDLTTKTVKQDNTQICIEVSGYITPENIGKAIDQTIHQQPNENTRQSLHQDEKRNTTSEKTEISDSESDPTSPFVVLSTVYVRPTEFYNNTVSAMHSNVLKTILAKNDSIRLVNDENEANFIITPKVLKAKVEPLNKETSRLQMVVSMETFDKNLNNLVAEHQNKLVMFNNEDDEQALAKKLLKQLFEQSSQSIFNLATKSNKQILQQQNISILSANKVPASIASEEDVSAQAE